MKQKATRKTIKNKYTNIIKVPYANLQHFLKWETVKYYNLGVYGWNWDCFELDYNTCIITGYRNTLGTDIDSNYIREINKKAKEILNKFTTFDEKNQKLDELKQEFLEHYEDHICK